MKLIVFSQDKKPADDYIILGQKGQCCCYIVNSDNYGLYSNEPYNLLISLDDTNYVRIVSEQSDPEIIDKFLYLAKTKKTKLTVPKSDRHILPTLINALTEQSIDTIYNNYIPRNIFSPFVYKGIYNQELYIIRLLPTYHGLIDEYIWADTPCNFIGLCYWGWYDRYLPNVTAKMPYWEEDFIYTDIHIPFQRQSPYKPERYRYSLYKASLAPFQKEGFDTWQEAFSWYKSKIKFLFNTEIEDYHIGKK